MRVMQPCLLRHKPPSQLLLSKYCSCVSSDTSLSVSALLGQGVEGILYFVVYCAHDPPEIGTIILQMTAPPFPVPRSQGNISSAGNCERRNAIPVIYTSGTYYEVGFDVVSGIQALVAVWL